MTKKKVVRKEVTWKVIKKEKLDKENGWLDAVTIHAYSEKQARFKVALRNYKKNQRVLNREKCHQEKENFIALSYKVWLSQVKELIKKRVRAIEVDRFCGFPLAVTIGVTPPESNQVKITFILTEENKILETSESKRKRSVIPDEFYAQAVKMAYGIFTDNEPS